MKNFFATTFKEAEKIGRGIKNLRSFKFGRIAGTFGIFGRKEKIAAVLLGAIFVLDISFSAARFYFLHTQAVPAYGGTYTEGFVGQPQFINPLLAQSPTDKALARLAYSGLYKFDDNGNLVPDLAQGMPAISKDQKTISINLKPNLQWQDLQPITSDDVIFTLQSVQNAQVKSPLRGLWENVKIQKTGNLSLQITTPNVSAPFLSNLVLGILPQHIWGKIAAANFSVSPYNLEPIGSGPYFMKEISKSPFGEINYIKMNSFAEYQGGKAYINTFEAKFFDNYQDAILALHSKTIQGLGFVPFDQKIYVDTAKTNLQIIKLPIPEYQALFINEGEGGSSILQDPAVREALAKSIDRQNLITTVYNGLAAPAYGPIMPQQLGYNSAVQNMNGYDSAAAGAILDKDGWAMNASSGTRYRAGQPLAFTITTNDYELNEESAENLQSQWKKIGVEVKINAVQTSDLENNYIRPRKFDAILFSESTGFDPDPFVFWHSSQARNPGYNLSQYRDSAADKLINEARNTFDPSLRAQNYRQFQALIENTVPAIFLDQSEFVYELSPDIKGTQFTELANPEDRFYDITHWYINTGRIWKK